MNLYNLKNELWPREWETFQLLAQGLSLDEVAEKMQIARSTVCTYRDHLYDLLGLKGVQAPHAKLVYKAIVELGLRPAK